MLDTNCILLPQRKTLETNCSTVLRRKPASVCRPLLSTARSADTRSEQIGRPIYWITSIVVVSIILLLAAVRGAFVQHVIEMNEIKIDEVRQLGNLLPLFNAGTNVMICLGAILLFLMTLETRVKGARALAMIRERRSLALLINMHQLTKDPERAMSNVAPTDASPQIAMTPFELGRYLDYCSEMLALTGKLAALYVQNFSDAVTLAAVNEVETLTAGLSHKIWKKMILVHQAIRQSS